MLSKKISDALNKQIAMEQFASSYYLAAASWCAVKGFEGASAFLFRHSDEERMHMLKLVHYLNDHGGHAQSPSVGNVPQKFKALPEMFKEILEHELEVSRAIHQLADFCFKEKDYSTFNFLQWFIQEQREEERLFTLIIEKFELVGNEGQGLFLADQYLKALTAGLPTGGA
jgi:ferritin